MFSHCAPKTLRPRRIDAASSLRRQTKAGHPAQARFGLLHRRIAGAGTLCRLVQICLQSKPARP